MEVAKLTLDKNEARELYREYKKHQHYSVPIDHEIQRAYQLIAQGRMVIRALESIKAAGLGPDSLPKLAIARATADRCILFPRQNESRITMSSKSDSWTPTRERSGTRFHFQASDFFGIKKNEWSYQAQMPIIPIHLRPKRGLANYHVLWEAEWTPVPPRDPLLLRRIGIGDMWLVVAAWDLTEVERAALATRMNS